MSNNNNRIETDSIGEISVENDKYWGAQTQRSLQNFQIGNEKMPMMLIKSLAIVKYCAASVNQKLKEIPLEKATTIKEVAQEIIDGKLNDHFPLSVWQTGSGTQTNMNVNEVISNRSIEKLGGILGSKKPIHPNDDVNNGQSSNDVFPTAMNIATIIATKTKLIPALDHIIKSLQNKTVEFKDIIKIGRTHLQDATPLSLGQEFSGYTEQIVLAKENIVLAMEKLYSLAQGATAVGTGINSSKEFANMFAQEVNKYLNETKFFSANNKFAAIASHDPLIFFSGSLNTLAISINKIANDIRFLACGPRAGINEINIPANEPGSSIMPGKINPTQIEAITMVCGQVIGQHLATTLGGMQGQLELNAYKPLIIYNVLQSIDLISDAMNSFTDHCLVKITANKSRIDYLMNQSLMLVTALNKHIGYDNAAKIAKYAYTENITLKQSALALQLVSGEDFDLWVDPKKMI